MSIRLDPRRVNALKHLAGEAGMRPGDLVRQWVEERIDASRTAETVAPGGPSLTSLVEALTARVSALEAAAGLPAATEPAPEAGTRPETATDQFNETESESQTEPAAEAETATHLEPGMDAIGREPAIEPEAEPRPRRKSVSAAPSGERVALHDEMIAVLREHGPMTAGELAGAIAERGRYAPPRSSKPLDAAMVSQRVSNPTYRSRFVRNEGRIGLAD